MSFQQWARDLPALRDDIRTHQEVSAELAERLRQARLQARVRDRDGTTGPDDLLLMPELYLPYPLADHVTKFVRKTGIAVLSGMTPREIPRVVRVNPTMLRRGTRVLVNEALLAMPEFSPSGIHPRVPFRTASFVVRKASVSAAERGLAKYLKAQTTTNWAFLPGLAWYRISYPGWGKTSLGVCSDLLDTGIWDWLRGRIQHFFLASWNPDVDLFDQMSWTRGYELFANIAVANHGESGGTLAWTPKRNFQRELFRVHGAKQGLAVSVRLPVRSLVLRQQTGLQASIQYEADEWKNTRMPGIKKPESLDDFKSPPPGYVPRHE